MYEKAAAINHKLYGAHYNLGLIAFIQREYEIAEKYFEQSLYGELEAMSYYQLAKLYVYKGEKDKAINFLNKAIELEPNLLKLAEKEKAFEKIRMHITVSVKMDEPIIKDINSEEFFGNNVLKEQETLARIYLEETSRVIEEMSENATKEKINEKLDYIFSKENKRKEITEKDRQTDKEERQRN